MNITANDIDEMKRCAKRELDKRKNFYPKWVASGKMTQEKADFETSGMEKIFNYFCYLQIHSSQATQQTLF